MKKFLLAAALVMASTSAMADRTVSGQGSSSKSKADACETAKYNARKSTHNDEQVEEYSKCDCDKDGDKWSCSVDAKVEKPKRN